MSDGFNPMRWDCTERGCFNVKRRPKIEAFAKCFPRRISFGDVDGLVELGGCFCLLEWKGQGGALTKGQRWSFEAFTRIPGNVVFLVDGDAEHMMVERYALFWKGRYVAAVPATLDELRERIRTWVRWIETRSIAA